MSLLTFAAKRRAARRTLLSIDISRRANSSKPAARCCSRRMGQTDGQTPCRYVDLAWCVQDCLNQWAHWARAQGPRIFFLFEGPPTGCGEINFFKLIILSWAAGRAWATGRASGL